MKQDSGGMERGVGSSRTRQFPITCIGMSAGGIGPLRTILKGLPGDSGMAFVVIPHLSRSHPTALPELISRWCDMPARLAETGLKLKPNHVYVIPPDKEMTIEDGHFSVQLRPRLPYLSNVITIFLESMTRCRKPPGIAVILSGMDADGAAALPQFKAHGGIVITQDAESSEYYDMPRSARLTGCVNYALPPSQIARKIETLGKLLQNGNHRPAHATA